MKLPKNFTLQLDQKITDLDLQLRLIYFEKGCYTIPIINLFTKNDDENLFSIGLRSHVKSSKGLAHILEHTTLCGSQRYPVRDPFFSMIKRSLNTYMNALTGSTFTAYPAGSRLIPDFYNLLDLYIDAVFYPQLTDESIYQEGYRLNVKDNDTLKIKECGVVYNEMKGVFDIPVRRLMREYSQEFYTGHSSSYVSGGDPKDIRNVNPQDIRNFHKRYYHPNNSVLYFYGPQEINKILEHLDTTFFSQLDPTNKHKPIPPLGKVNRYNKPKTIKATYPSQTIERASMVLISYLTITVESSADLLALLAFRIIDSILTGHDGAKFKQELLKEKNKKGTPLLVEIDSYLDDNSSELAFTLFCKGCNKNEAKEIKHVVDQKLTLISQTPFTKDEISSAIHQEKFADLEIGGSGENYGLELFFRSCIFLHSPKENAKSLLFDSLNLNKTYKILEEKCSEDPLYLNKMITTHLLKNKHNLTVEFNPDPLLAEKEEKENQEYVRNIEQELTEEAISSIKQINQRLKEYQEKDESEGISSLPILSEKELPSKVTTYALFSSKKPLNLYYHPCYTNSIVYLETTFNIGSMPCEDLPYLRLFSMYCTEVGTKGVCYTSHLKEVEQFLGSLSASLLLDRNLKDNQTGELLLILQSKCFFNHRVQMFAILKRIITEIDFTDKERLTELLKQSATNMKLSLNNKAYSYARSQAEATLTPQGLLHEKMYGYSFYIFIQDLVDKLDENLPKLQKKFQKFIQHIFSHPPELLLSCDKKEAKEILNEKLYSFNQLHFKEKLSIKPFIFPKKLTLNQPSYQKLDLQMAYNASAIKTIDITHPHAAHLQLAAFILRYKFLHTVVREQGGAYGSSALYKAFDGIFSFSSYRDPEVEKTFKAFEDSIQVIIDQKFSNEDLFEAKLQALQKEEKIIPINLRAFTTYIRKKVGLTDKIQRRYRKTLLKATKEDVVRAVKQYIMPNIKEKTKISFRGK